MCEAAQQLARARHLLDLMRGNGVSHRLKGATMPKCDCVFEVVDRFGHFTYHCTVDNIHAGPHYDSDQNYTWGAITGYDPWSKWRQEQEHQKRVKRAESAGKLKLGKWGRK